MRQTDRILKDQTRIIATLARMKWHRLSPLERRMVRTLSKGEEFVVGDGCLPVPLGAGGFPRDRILRSDRVTAFLKGRVEGTDPIETRIRIRGAAIVGKLDLVRLGLPKDLRLSHCALNDIDLQDAVIGGLHLTGSHCDRLNTENAHIGGSILLNKGFASRRGLHLVGTKVQGRLSCKGASIEGVNDIAVNANGVVVGGDVYLSDRFTATGSVRFPGAEIGGVFNLGGAVIRNGAGTALSINGTRIAGSVYLDKGFRALGVVRLPGAEVGGQLIVADAVLTNRAGPAISAQSLSVSDDVEFRAASIHGAVDFTGAHLHRSVEFKSGQYFYSDDPTVPATAIKFDAAHIGRSVKLDPSIEVQGQVRFASTKIDGDLRIELGSLFCPKETDGTEPPAVYLSRATVGGTFYWNPASAPSGGVDITSVVTSVFEDRGNWPVMGGIRASGFSFGRFSTKTDVSASTRIAWLSAQRPVDLKADFKPQPWRMTVRALRDMGHDQDANRVLIEMGDVWRSSQPWGARRLWDAFKSTFLGYGHRPWPLFVTIVAYLMVGWLVFAGGYSKGVILPDIPPVYASADYNTCLGTEPIETPDRVEACLDDLFPEYMSFHAFVFSLDTFIPLVDLHQESAWEPRDHPDAWFGGMGYRIYYWLHIAFGWILTTLAVVVLSGVVKPKED